MKMKIIRTLAILVVLIMNVSCDQISKSVVRQTVHEYQEISVIKNFVTVTKVENAGAFLSLGTSLPDTVRFILLTLLPLIVLGFGVGFLFFKNDLSKAQLAGFTFVLGGGIGNIYDRLVHGTVTDFLHMNFGIFQTGIFNMADVSIMTGVFIVLLDSLFNLKASQEKAE
ncbi:MAG TPA: signal peptidase II [Cyclobacteriaceae bacterium]|nr:signal peptidase II [Cyclobacteriaceae bacterium]